MSDEEKARIDTQAHARRSGRIGPRRTRPDRKSSRTCNWNAPRTCSKAFCFTASCPGRKKSRSDSRFALERGITMILLALETSCDETSAAVVRDGRILSNLIASQVSLHAEYGGVVPELAAREHLRNLIPVAQAALQEAGIAAGATRCGRRHAGARIAHRLAGWIQGRPGRRVCPAKAVPRHPPSRGPSVFTVDSPARRPWRISPISTQRFAHCQRRTHPARAGGVGIETSRPRLDDGRCRRANALTSPAN